MSASSIKISKGKADIILQDIADGVPYQQATAADGVSLQRGISGLNRYARSNVRRG